MVIQRVMLIPYNDIEHGNEDMTPSLMEKKLYKVNTKIQANLPSAPAHHIEEKDDDIDDKIRTTNIITSNIKKKNSKLNFPLNPIINEWIDEMKPHLSNAQLTSKKTFSLLNGIYAKFGKDKKPWNKDFNLIINEKISHLASIIDLIRHIHVYQIKHTPIEILDIYIKFLNTIGYPLTNVSSHAMKERMKHFIPSFQLPKKRKMSDEFLEESPNKTWLTLS